MTDISGYPMLAEAQRIAARAVARTNQIDKIGQRPERGEFSHHTASQYPVWLSRLVFVLCLFLLLAAFSPSAIRLYTEGSQTFGEGFGRTGPSWLDRAKQLVGAATVLTAEIGQIVFSLAFAIVASRKETRAILSGGMIVSTAIALVGNIKVASPGFTVSEGFAWLEALSPPLLVLGTAYVLKEQLLSTIQRHNANETAYQAALARWQQDTAYPEQHPGWRDTYAFALWETWKRKHRKLAAAVSVEVRDAIVLREMDADRFFADQPVEVVQPQPVNIHEHPGIQRERVKQHLAEHPEDQDLTLAALSEKVGVSYSTVQRVVKEYSRNGH